MTRPTANFIRYSLGIILLFVAVNAFGGGYYGMSGAKGIATEWLKDSPFSSYFIPGLVLFICIGGSAVITAIAVFRSANIACNAAFGCGVIILGWLGIQVGIIGYVSWMQPTTAFVAILILVLTGLLKKYERQVKK